jgi:hypothetical protein
MLNKNVDERKKGGNESLVGKERKVDMMDSQNKISGIFK